MLNHKTNYQAVRTLLKKEEREMTPYERGYLAGASDTPEGASQTEDAYFTDLSGAGRAAYDLGFFDGQNGSPLPGEQ